MADDLHIRVDQPKRLRKELLESALHASEFLQVMDKIQQYEQDRLALKTELLRTVTVLTIAADQFFKSIPPLPMEFIQKQQQVMQRQMLQQQPLKVLTPREERASRLQPREQPTTAPSFRTPLEEEIDELKRRIHSLSV